MRFLKGHPDGLDTDNLALNRADDLAPDSSATDVLGSSGPATEKEPSWLIFVFEAQLFLLNPIYKSLIIKQNAKEFLNKTQINKMQSGQFGSEKRRQRSQTDRYQSVQD